MGFIDPKIQEQLICPITKTQLIYDAASNELISNVSGLAYKIVSGIPIMLPEEARIIDEDKVRMHYPQLFSDE